MIRKTINSSPGTLEIVVEGNNPQEVSLEVNKLYNFGFVSSCGIPDAYNEKKDLKVSLRTGSYNLDRALETMAYSQLKYEQLFDGKYSDIEENSPGWRELMVARINDIEATFNKGAFYNSFKYCRVSVYQFPTEEDIDGDRDFLLANLGYEH